NIMISSELGACWDENTFYMTTSFGKTHVILKTITRTRTLKGGGFGLTVRYVDVWHYFRFVFECTFIGQCVRLFITTNSRVRAYFVYVYHVWGPIYLVNDGCHE